MIYYIKISLWLHSGPMIVPLLSSGVLMLTSILIWLITRTIWNRLDKILFKYNSVCIVGNYSGFFLTNGADEEFDQGRIRAHTPSPEHWFLKGKLKI